VIRGCLDVEWEAEEVGSEGDAEGIKGVVYVEEGRSESEGET